MIKQIPMLDLQLEYQYMKSDIDTAIKKCLDHQKWILGPEVEELENKIAKYLDVKYCIGASSEFQFIVCPSKIDSAEDISSPPSIIGAPLKGRT